MKDWNWGQHRWSVDPRSHLCWILVVMFPTVCAKLTFLLYYTFVFSTCFKLHVAGQNPFCFLHFSSYRVSSIFSSLAFPRFRSSSVTRLGHFKPNWAAFERFFLPLMLVVPLCISFLSLLPLDASHFHCWPGSFACVGLM